MVQALHLTGEETQVLSGFADILDKLKSKKSSFTLEAANKVYAEETFPMLDPFVASVKQCFRAEPESVDFIGAAAEARDKINRFVEDKTRQKIKDLLPEGSVDENTRVVLVNAVYFKGLWEIPFDKDATRKLPFHVSPGRAVEADMMCLRNESFATGFFPELDANVLEMPYQGGQLSMLLFLPARPEGFRRLEDSFSAFDLVGARMPRREEHERVVVPRFRLNCSHALVEALSDLGVRDLFDSRAADMTGISREGLHSCQFKARSGKKF